MQETLYKGSPRSEKTEPFHPTFKLFVACEDHAALHEAEKVEEQIKELCGDMIDVSRVLWNFSLLRHNQLRDYAIAEAAAADMIVISFHATSPLPEHVKSWLQQLPPRTHAGQAALVTLIGSKKEIRAARRAQIAYLRKIADKRGLDFFCNQDEWENREFSNPTLQRTDFKQLDPQEVIFNFLPGSVG